MSNTYTSDFFTFFRQLINNIESNKPSAFKSLRGKKQQSVFFQTLIFQKSLLKNMLHRYLFNIQRGVHMYIYVYIFIGSQIEQGTLKTTLRWRWSNDPAGIVSRIEKIRVIFFLQHWKQSQERHFKALLTRQQVAHFHPLVTWTNVLMCNHVINIKAQLMEEEK